MYIFYLKSQETGEYMQKVVLNLTLDPFIQI